MQDVNFADLDPRYDHTPPDLVGMYPLGGGGLLEAPYRHHFELRHLLKLARVHKRMNVLELGSGNGRWAVSVAPLVAHYTGVDVTSKAVDLARAAVAKRGIRNAEFHERSILDFAGDRPYDVVYFSGVSQYLEDDQIRAVMRNLAPWLKPDSIVIDRSTIRHDRREIIRHEGYYSILRTPRELEALFGEFGFRLIYRRRSYRFLRGAKWLRLGPLDRLLPRIAARTQPLSLYLLLALSWIADALKPLDRGWSHDFLLFAGRDAT